SVGVARFFILEVVEADRSPRFYINNAEIGEAGLPTRVLGQNFGDRRGEEDVARVPAVHNALGGGHATASDSFVALGVAHAEHGSTVNPHAQAKIEVVLRSSGDGDGAAQGRFRTAEKRQGNPISGDQADELAIALGVLNG